MKKPIAFIAALTIALGSFAACSGKNSNSSEPTESSAPAAHVTTVAFDKEKGEAIAKEIISGYFDDINKGDIAASMKYQYDDNMLKAAAVLSGLAEKGDTAEQAVEKMMSAYKESYNGHTLTLNNIISVDSIPENGYVLLDEAYGRLCELNKLVEKSKDDLDPQKISEEYQKLTDFSSYRREYEEGYDVVASVTVDTETKDQEMLVFHTKDGNWQIDMSVPAYMQKSDQVNMDNTASSTASAATAVLKEMAAEGKDISGTFIIGKDPSKDYNVPDSFDMDTFRYRYAEKYSGDPDADYFIVINDSYAIYAAYEISGQRTGIYPFGLMIKDDGSPKLTYSELDTEKTYDLAALYDMARSVIG